jgi:hypothetical protein
MFVQISGAKNRLLERFKDFVEKEIIINEKQNIVTNSLFTVFD